MQEVRVLLLPGSVSSRHLCADEAGVLPQNQLLQRPDRASVPGCRWQMGTPRNVSLVLQLPVWCQGLCRVELLARPLHCCLVGVHGCVKHSLLEHWLLI